MNTIDTKQELKEIRKKKQMSQPVFADWIGVPVHTYRNWETGRRQCKPWILNLIKRLKD